MFVCFEGIDGAGKTTQTRMLFERLRAAGTPVELVADPGTTKIGLAIRQILLHNDDPISPAAQMLLFSAARAELAEYIKARLAENVVVLCDRWLLSTLVYQSSPAALILDIFRGTTGLYPDICFLLDLPPETAKDRMGAPGDRYERRCMQERRRMRELYLQHALNEQHAKRTHVINADTSADCMHAEVYGLFVRASSPVTTEDI